MFPLEFVSRAIVVDVCDNAEKMALLITYFIDFLNSQFKESELLNKSVRTVS